MSESTLRCGYCTYYSSGNVHKSGNVIKRACIPRRINVEFDHRTCKYFNPSKFFHCDKHGERVTLIDCSSRRINYSQLDKNLYCKRCRQFDQQISEIINQYIIHGCKVKKYNPENPLRKLARRNDPKAKRKLKRRNPKKRVLKKRNKKPERKLKRRK